MDLPAPVVVPAGVALEVVGGHLAQLQLGPLVGPAVCTLLVLSLDVPPEHGPEPQALAGPYHLVAARMHLVGHAAESLPRPLGWVDDLAKVLLVDVDDGALISLLHAEVLLAAPDLIKGRVLLVLKFSVNKVYDLFVVLALLPLLSDVLNVEGHRHLCAAGGDAVDLSPEGVVPCDVLHARLVLIHLADLVPREAVRDLVLRPLQVDHGVVVGDDLLQEPDKPWIFNICQALPTKV